MLKSQEFRKEYPEQNIQDLTMFRFDQCNAQANPFSLQDYPADVRHSKGSQHHRIIELENALQSKSEEVIYLRTELQDMQAIYKSRHKSIRKRYIKIIKN